MPQALADDHPDAVIEVIEIDPVIEQLGRRFFRLDHYQGRVHPLTGDARVFLAATTQRYDLIFGDAFRGRQTVPPHLATREFFDLVHQRLMDKGVYMMNLMGALEGPRSELFCSVAATLREVFPELYVFAVYPQTPCADLQNLVLVAPARPLGWTKHDLLARADDPPLATMVAGLVDQAEYDLSAATVLTDDFSPVEMLVTRQLRE